MKCSNCNTPLVEGNNICPNCGALNMDFNDNSNEEKPTSNIEDPSSNTNNEEILNITENMAPPALQVNEENLTQGVKDIQASNDISTYAPQDIEEVSDEETIDSPIPENVNIAIPAVQKSVNEGNVPSDANISDNDIKSSEETIDETNEIDDNVNIKMNNRMKVPKIKKLFPLFLIIIGFILGLTLGSTMFKKNICISTNTGSKQTTKVVHVNDGKNNTTKAGKYTFKIPDAYYYDKLSGGILIYDEEASWRIYVRADNGSYENMATAKVSIQETLKENEVSVNTIKEMRINERNYLIVEGLTKLTNRLIAFTDALNDYVFYVEIVDADNNYNYEVLKIADDIIANATFNESENAMESINIYDISAMCITAAEAYKSLNR